MNHMNDLTTREYAAGLVECRICGLKFLPDPTGEQVIARWNQYGYLIQLESR